MGIVITILNGKRVEWNSRKEAISFFTKEIICSEGEELGRCCKIMNALESGEMICTDT